MKMEVRCCCNAGKLLGYMDVPEGTRGKFFAGPDNLELEVAPYISGVQLVVQGIMGIEFPPEVAVKSNDYPMEELKKIPSFEEVK